MEESAIPSGESQPTGTSLSGLPEMGLRYSDPNPESQLGSQGEPHEAEPTPADQDPLLHREERIPAPNEPVAPEVADEQETVREKTVFDYCRDAYRAIGARRK